MFTHDDLNADDLRLNGNAPRTDDALETALAVLSGQTRNADDIANARRTIAAIMSQCLDHSYVFTPTDVPDDRLTTLMDTIIFG